MRRTFGSLFVLENRFDLGATCTAGSKIMAFFTWQQTAVFLVGAFSTLIGTIHGGFAPCNTLSKRQCALAGASSGRPDALVCYWSKRDRKCLLLFSFDAAVFCANRARSRSKEKCLEPGRLPEGHCSWNEKSRTCYRKLIIHDTAIGVSGQRQLDLRTITIANDSNGEKELYFPFVFSKSLPHSEDTLMSRADHVNTLLQATDLQNGGENIEHIIQDSSSKRKFEGLYSGFHSRLRGGERMGNFSAFLDEYYHDVDSHAGLCDIIENYWAGVLGVPSFHLIQVQREVLLPPWRLQWLNSKRVTES